MNFPTFCEDHVALKVAWQGVGFFFLRGNSLKFKPLLYIFPNCAYILREKEKGSRKRGRKDVKKSRRKGRIRGGKG